MCTACQPPASVLPCNAMRDIVAILLVLGLSACRNAEQAGAEAIKKEAETERMATAQRSEPTAPKRNPPVPGNGKLSCGDVIDVAKFTRALGETAPITVADSKSEAMAAASCSLVRGGRRLTEGEQKSQIKRHGRLGVMPGDEICNISTFCWTIEDADRFAAKCLREKDKLDDALGFQACVRVIPTGADDVNRYQFFDPDTKCIFQVRAGPSMVDNEFIGKCAKAARDLIGPDEIRIHAAPPS